MEPSPLKAFLVRNYISQADLARGIDRTTAFVAQLAAGDCGASQETIQRTLLFFTQRLARRVTYEEVFGEPAVIDCPAATVAPEAL